MCLFQVYVGSKSTLAEGSSFGSTRGTENEITEMEVRTLQNAGGRAIPIYLASSYYFFRFILHKIILTNGDNNNLHALYEQCPTLLSLTSIVWANPLLNYLPLLEFLTRSHSYNSK